MENNDHYDRLESIQSLIQGIKGLLNQSSFYIVAFNLGALNERISNWIREIEDECEENEQDDE